MSASAPPRLLYIDNLRLFVIICVVMHHLAVTYSGDGSFYYIEPARMGALSQLWFTVYLTFQQAYFMGLMFLLAGYFTAGSYDRKGFGGFVKDRAARLLVPTLVYMVIVSPAVSNLELGQAVPAGISARAVFAFLFSYGVMWFAVALFVFSVIYGFARVLRPGPAAQKPGKTASALNLWALILIIAAGAFVIRIAQPIGTSVLGMQLCYFSSYIALFAAGIYAYRRGIFANISYKSAKHWLIAAVAGGFVSIIALGIALKLAGAPNSTMGGGSPGSAGFALWESFVAVAMCAGLIGVFKEKLNRRNNLVKAMCGSYFAVYVFHPVIIVGAALLFAPAALPPFVKWLIMCAVCVPLCFAFAHFVLKKIPLLKNVL